MKALVSILVLVPSLLSAAVPQVMVVGIWPNRLQFLDEETFEVVSQLGLRNGAVVWDTGGYTRTTHSPDFSRLYFITGTMETLEIVDVIRQEVVDEVKLSTPERKARLMGAVPTPDGKRVYLTVHAVKMKVDRFDPDRELDIVLYDLETREVANRVVLPQGVSGGDAPTLWVSPTGDAVFVPGAEKIYELDAETHHVSRAIEVKKPGLAGYGARNAGMWYETSPGVYYSAFTTEDPVMERAASGLLRFDASSRAVTGFELGPSLAARVLAMSPDGKRVFLGGNDLAVVDLERRQLVAQREGFERGRANTGWVVSSDGTKLYVGGVGDRIKIYDAESLELLDEEILQGDSMFAPFLIPRRLVESASR